MKKIIQSESLQKIEIIEYEYDSFDEFYSHYIQMTNDNYKIKYKLGLWIEYIRCTKVN